MKQILTILIILHFSTTVNAQRGFLLIKKNEKTVQTYTTGAFITLEHKFGYRVSGILAHIKKDSFSILNYNIQKKIDYRGFVIFDTVYNGYSYFDKNDIKSIPIKKRRNILQTASAASYLASMSFTILAIVNGVKFSDSLSEIGKNVAIKGGGFFALGLGLSKLTRTEYKMGKKFKIGLMQF